MIKVKRVYEPLDAEDGTRFLVERLWPRGIRKEDLHMEGWLKEAAPSPALRQWYSHDVSKWEEFKKRYQAELAAEPGAWQPIVEAGRAGNVTLLYSARDTEHNSAIALKEYAERTHPEL